MVRSIGRTETVNEVVFSPVLRDRYAQEKEVLRQRMATVSQKTLNAHQKLDSIHCDQQEMRQSVRVIQQEQGEIARAQVKIGNHQATIMPKQTTIEQNQVEIERHQKERELDQAEMEIDQTKIDQRYERIFQNTRLANQNLANIHLIIPQISSTWNRIFNKGMSLQSDYKFLRLQIKEIEQIRDEIQQQAVLIRQDETLIKQSLDNAEQKWSAIQTKISVIQQSQEEMESQEKEIQQKQDLIQQSVQRVRQALGQERASFMNDSMVKNLTPSSPSSVWLTLLKKIVDLSSWMLVTLGQFFAQVSDFVKNWALSSEWSLRSIAENCPGTCISSVFLAAARVKDKAFPALGSALERSRFYFQRNV